MLALQTNVIVEDGMCESCTVPNRRVHHRAFPEVWVECSSLADGLASLARGLGRYAEGARGAWQREAVDLAVTEIAAALSAMAADEFTRSTETACECAPRTSSSARQPRKARKASR